MDAPTKRIFWHRELPPLAARELGEHWLEATSEPVPYGFSHRAELWGKCIASLKANADERFGQEIDRLGGDYAHVLDERVTQMIDHDRSLYWLVGRYDYFLYGRDQG